MSILEKLVENKEVTSEQLFQCVVATVDDDTMKKIIGEGLFMFGQSELIMQHTKKETGRALKRFYKNAMVWQTNSIVLNILMFLDSRDYTWKSVCTKWNEMYNDVNESQTITKQPYLTITDDLDEFIYPPRLTGILDLNTAENDTPVVAQIRKGPKYDDTLGVSIVVAGRWGDLKHAILTDKLILKLHKTGDLTRLEKDCIIEITKSSFNETNYTTYIDELQIW